MAKGDICERFVCPNKASCDEYHATLKTPSRSKPCDFEKASTCGDGRCYNCIHTDTCPVIFRIGQYPTETDIHRLVCNPGHTCKDKTHQDCGNYPPFKFTYCDRFTENCRRVITPVLHKTPDGKPGLMFMTFVIPQSVLDDYITHIATRLRNAHRGVIPTMRQVMRAEDERRKLHRIIMEFFPGWSYDVGIVSSAFRKSVEWYVEERLRKMGLIE